MSHIHTPVEPGRLAKLAVFGGLGGAAIGVLISVIAGSAPIGPVVFPAMTAALGMATLALVSETWSPPRWFKVSAIAAWAVAVAAASVFVIAAIALSNFE